MNVEILTSPEFHEVLNTFGIYGLQTYKYNPNNPSIWADGFEIWSVPEEALTIMSKPSEDEWIDQFDDKWWRYCEGTNLEGGPTHHFEINGKGLICWNNPDFSDYYTDEDFDGQLVLFNRDYSYDNVLQYCREEWGVGTPKNVCAICIGLAKMNNMTLGELFARYMNGGDLNEEVS